MALDCDGGFFNHKDAIFFGFNFEPFPNGRFDVVEGTAALTILAYLAYLRFSGSWNQNATPQGVWYSVATGICVGIGTILFFVLFQKGGPLSAVPMILAGGAAIMAIAGIFFFKESASASRLLGIVLALAGLFLLKA